MRRSKDQDLHGEVHERKVNKGKNKMTAFLAFASLGIIYG